MKTTEFNLLFATHDVKNFIGAALSYLQLATIKNNDLENDVDIAASIESLWAALNSAREIALNAEPAKTDKSSTGYSLTPAKEHITTNTAPFIDSLRKLYPTIEINSSFNTREEDKHIAVNPESFNQAIGNIIGNAVEAGASVIDIHTVMRAYCLVITIHDNGSGMSSEEVDRIMLSQFGDGLVDGIGTKSILITAAEHDFPLTYTSVEGEGTTIKFLMPYIKV
ncbi:MAG: ATP-binding protein [Gammaproteobacteria bacterium]|nr:ATP-binding protein [Gammaproteobacteria bacterium]